MTLTRESLILIGICIIDLVSTLFLLNTRAVLEGNPLMSFYLSYGIVSFILAKLTLIVLPLFVAEWSRQFKPKFVQVMLRATIAAYLVSYLVFFLIANMSFFYNLPYQDIVQTQAF